MDIPILQENYRVTKFNIELSQFDLEDVQLNRKYSAPNNDFVWIIKDKNNERNCLILESCKNFESIELIEVLYYFFNDANFCWKKEPYKSKKLLPQDLLSLPVEVMEFGKVRKKFEFKIYYKNDIQTDDECSHCSPLDELVRDFASLMKNEESSDVTIIVGSEKFLVHKLILSTRSSVLAAMFNSDILEKEKGLVEIEGISPGTFKFLLEFIYTGQIVADKNDNDNVNWLELALAATKYNIKSLQKISTKKLAENVNSDNALDILILSDSIKDDELKKISSNFIIENKSKIVDTEKYEEMIRSNTDLALELFRDFMSNKYSTPKKRKLS